MPSLLWFHGFKNTLNGFDGVFFAKAVGIIFHDNAGHGGRGTANVVRRFSLTDSGGMSADVKFPDQWGVFDVEDGGYGICVQSRYQGRGISVICGITYVVYHCVVFAV